LSPMVDREYTMDTGSYGEVFNRRFTCTYYNVYYQTFYIYSMHLKIITSYVCACTKHVAWRETLLDDRSRK